MIEGSKNVFFERNSVSTRSNSIFSRKAQSTASGAANLISLLALIIVLYILFVPPDVREELLDGSSSSDSDDGITISGNLISYLVDKQPGELEVTPQYYFDHNIPYFNLKENKYSNALVEENPFQIKRSWFSNKNKIVNFAIPSIRETQNLMMSFSVANPKGNLIIKLNGNEIFNQELSDNLISPIELPIDFIGEENTLEFVASPPDLAFWRSNRYDISSLYVTGDFVDKSSLDNSHKFFLEKPEFENIEKSWLIFAPLCDVNNVGKLSIHINGQSIYSAIPDCSDGNVVYFNPNVFKEYENVISFASAEGEYAIDLANVRTRLDEIEYPKYYFELSDSTYDEIKDGDQYINVSMMMPDDDEFKEAYILVNSVKLGFIDTRENSYSKVIPRQVLQEGTNTIAIEPLNTFDVISFHVGLYD